MRIGMQEKEMCKSTSINGTSLRAGRQRYHNNLVLPEADEKSWLMEANYAPITRKHGNV